LRRNTDTQIKAGQMLGARKVKAGSTQEDQKETGAREIARSERDWGNMMDGTKKLGKVQLQEPGPVLLRKKVKEKGVRTFCSKTTFKQANQGAKGKFDRSKGVWGEGGLWGNTPVVCPAGTSVPQKQRSTFQKGGSFALKTITG